MHSRLSSRSGRCALRGSLREEAACRRVAEPGHPTARRPQIRTSACLGVYRRCARGVTGARPSLFGEPLEAIERAAVRSPIGNEIPVATGADLRGQSFDPRFGPGTGARPSFSVLRRFLESHGLWKVDGSPFRCGSQSFSLHGPWGRWRGPDLSISGANVETTESACFMAFHGLRAGASEEVAL